ncbi:FAD-dependent oxidoreductase [Aquiflexum sp.]|uniref:FAD-dependent oxidoreductase n=1 Tax=Aquiflexum sp. TaxID=1872584 RepID=UPI003593B76D
MMSKSSNAIVILILLCNTAFGQSTIQRDIIIYRATASGVTAAVAAAREGVSVLLIEPGRNIGGMVTGGLSHTDYGDRTVIGGLTTEFYQKIADHYKTHVFYWRGPEPHVGEKILKDWLDESGVEMIYGKRVIAVEKNNNSISKITLSDNSQVTGSVHERIHFFYRRLE